jgi:two-component system chemotaxis response regulator CheY
MDFEALQERYLETLDAVQALLELITRREKEINALYGRIETLEEELGKRDKIIGVLKGSSSEGTPGMQSGNAVSNEYGNDIPMALLVDPMPRMRLILKEIITSAGYMIVGEAGDLRSAVTLTKHGKPDLVIINARLGNDSGLDALKQMREVIPELKAILITDGPDPIIVISALEQGVADIIPKPINRLRLHELARSLAESR